MIPKFPALKESKGSLPYSQKPDTDLYHKPDEPNSHLCNSCLQDEALKQSNSTKCIPFNYRLPKHVNGLQKQKDFWDLIF